MNLLDRKIDAHDSIKQFDSAVDVLYRRGVPPGIAMKPNADAAPSTKQDDTFQAALE